MKLTKSNLIETIRKFNDGKIAYQARKVTCISVRRVYQVKDGDCIKTWSNKATHSDHGSTFTSNFVNGKSRFREYLLPKGIKPILCRIRHPRSNGKIEKWFQAYDSHRNAFKTTEDFSHWYNDLKPHKDLNFDELKTSLKLL